MSVAERVLVTGATGFIGARLCERLVFGSGSRVRALVHSWPNAVSVAHLPVEMMAGDLVNPASVREALRDCDAVVHLATGGRQGIVLGTQNLAAAATRMRIGRLIHMSTTAVYGLTPPDTLSSEAAPLKNVGEPYCDWKIAAERAVWRGIRSGLAAVILRPCIVYGPNSRWNTTTIDKLRRGEFHLLDEGQGVCNTVYVDNLIDAVLAGLRRPEAVGEAFFVTDEKPVSWGEFAAAHAALLEPTPNIPSVPADTVFTYHRARGGLIRRSAKPLLKLLLSPAFHRSLQTVPIFDRLLMEVAGRLSPGRKAFVKRWTGLRYEPSRPAVTVPDLVTASVQSCKVTFSSDKAKHRLGYAPRVSFQEGMALTAEWLRWAGYLRSGR